MINDEICKLRDKLNKSIENGEDYEVIYKLSVELDELIAKFYKEKMEKNSKQYVCFFFYTRKCSAFSFAFFSFHLLQVRNVHLCRLKRRR